MNTKHIKLLGFLLLAGLSLQLLAGDFRSYKFGKRSKSQSFGSKSFSGRTGYRRNRSRSSSRFNWSNQYSGGKSRQKQYSRSRSFDRYRGSRAGRFEGSRRNRWNRRSSREVRDRLGNNKPRLDRNRIPSYNNGRGNFGNLNRPYRGGSSRGSKQDRLSGKNRGRDSYRVRITPGKNQHNPFDRSGGNYDKLGNRTQRWRPGDGRRSFGSRNTSPGKGNRGTRGGNSGSRYSLGGRRNSNLMAGDKKDEKQKEKDAKKLHEEIKKRQDAVPWYRKVQGIFAGGPDRGTNHRASGVRGMCPPEQASCGKRGRNWSELSEKEKARYKGKSKESMMNPGNAGSFSSSTRPDNTRVQSRKDRDCQRMRGGAGCDNSSGGPTRDSSNDPYHDPVDSIQGDSIQGDSRDPDGPGRTSFDY